MHKGYAEDLIVPEGLTLPPPGFERMQQSPIHIFEVIFTNLKRVP